MFPVMTDSSIRVKNHKRYLFYRVYAVLAIVGWNVYGFSQFARMQEPDYGWFFLPLVLPAIFMGFNLMTFPFNYSIFGPLNRTASPDEHYVEKSRATAGRVSWMHATAPFFTHTLYQRGLEVSALLIGKAFMPFTDIVKMKHLMLWGYAIHHKNPEIRTPVMIYDKRFCKKLIQACKENNINLDES